jgi:alkanesulfonate monooxygenase SsuD/methylene tetrahydromethanopterin reductase-like flavin-dependent oxidoreductase (luciferase family)
MPAFRPTLPPPGRLVRLGVVLDARNPAGRLAEVARMCDRVGIGAVWVDDSARPGPPPAKELDAWTALAALAPATTRVRLGAMLLAGRRPAPLLAEMAATLATLAGDRVEVSLLAAADAPLRPYADAFTGALATPAAAGDGARPGGRPTVAVEVGDPEKLDRESLDWLVGVADDVLVTAADVDRVAETARELRAACALAGREPETLGVAVRLPVSVGRTVTEARARWDAEPAFAELGPPEQAGVYGTLEQCHQRVIAFAHAGVTDLRCVLPNAADVHDVIAQVTAMTVGTVDKLAPGAPRSPAPPPPEGWGGRPRFPGGSPPPPTGAGPGR